MMHTQEIAILALEIRQSRIGYALFLGPKRLIDWGATAVPPECIDSENWAQQRTAALLRQYIPECIVAKRQRSAKLPQGATGVPILKGIQSVAQTQGIPIQFLARDEIYSAFASFSLSTKEDIACALTEMFPELLIRLAPVRKWWWNSEPRRMIVFDAIATGFAYWQRLPSRE